MSYFLTVEVARQALGLVRPVFDKLVADGLTGGRVNLHVAVYKPGSDDVLCEESWGEDPATWQRRYNEIALGKGDVISRTGLVGRTTLNDAPWLFRKGDVRYAGGVIENGLVVVASGLQDYWDEAISWMVVSTIQALCRALVAAIPADAPTTLG